MNATASLQRGATLATLFAVLAVAAIAAGAGFWFGARHSTVDRSAAQSASAILGAPTAATPDAATASDARKPLYWHDPMVPNAKFDKPGKSPFMDMQLVPVYADAAGDAGGVAISARQVQNFGVRTAAVTEGSLDTGFSAVGAVGIDERAVVAVQARSQGYVERLHVRAQYDSVAAGQPLADLYVPDWLAAQEEWLALKASTQPSARAARRCRAAAPAPARHAGCGDRARRARRQAVGARDRDRAAGRNRLGDRRARRDGRDARRDAVQARRDRHGVGDGRRSGSTGGARSRRGDRSRHALPRIRTARSRATSTRCSRK